MGGRKEMPNPEEGSFHTPGPRSPPVRAPLQIGEEVEIRLTPDTELALRVQALERAIACCPFCYNTYNKELESVGLKKSNLKLTW